jgi:hypothetical protein
LVRKLAKGHRSRSNALRTARPSSVSRYAVTCSRSIRTKNTAAEALASGGATAVSPASTEKLATLDRELDLTRSRDREPCRPNRRKRPRGLFRKIAVAVAEQIKVAKLAIGRVEELAATYQAAAKPLAAALYRCSGLASDAGAGAELVASTAQTVEQVTASTLAKLVSYLDVGARFDHADPSSEAASS